MLSFAERIKKIAKENYGVEVIVKDGKDKDSFESLFGVSLEEAKVRAKEERGDVEDRSDGESNNIEILYKQQDYTLYLTGFADMEILPEAA